MKHLRAVVCVTVLAFCATALFAQLHPLNVSVNDSSAAAQATSLRLSANRALTDTGRSVSESSLRFSSESRGNDNNSRPVLFPADLSFNGGPVITTGQLHNVFINDPPSAWGNPLRFLSDMNHSDFIHITDQYVGSDENNRYPIGQNFSAAVAPGAAFPNKPANIITFNQVLGLVHAAGSITGTGVGNVINIFIPPGLDTCFPGNKSCFSPDNLSTFAFCAFHGAVTFTDIGTTVFTVEPETGVIGCASQQPSPNGIVADSVDSTLSHESFETITDPLLNAWFVTGSLDLGGAEIGDVCQPGGNDQFQFLVPTFRVNGHPYAIQLEYSNRGHGCFSRPQGGGD